MKPVELGHVLKGYSCKGFSQIRKGNPGGHEAEFIIMMDEGVHSQLLDYPPPANLLKNISIQMSFHKY